MAETMRAERFYADTKTVALEDVPIPHPGPGEVLVKVAFCGICHSDLSLINGTFPAQRPVVTQGHEASGTIAKLGDGVTGWSVGDRVIVAAGRPCGDCPNCRRGDTGTCLRMQLMAFAYDGAWAEYTVAHAAGLTRVPDNVPLDQAAILADAAGLFRSHLGGAVTVVNDADAAGIAEMHFGAGRGRNGVVILLTFGTGIGSAIFHDGKLLPNSEFGHLQIHGKDAEKRASEKVREDKGLSWKKWAGRVSDYMAYLEKLFSPDLFIIGGGVSNKADKFLPLLTSKTEVLVEAAQMRNEAGIIGAACLAVHPDGPPVS